MKLRFVSIFKPRKRNRPHHPWLIAVGTGKNRTVVVGSTNRADTEAVAENLSRVAQRVHLGIGSSAELRQAVQRRRRITDHLNEYQGHLIACGKTKKHAIQMRTYAEECLEDAPTVDDIVSSSVQARIARVDAGPSAKNRRAYAVRHFLRWGLRDNRWSQSIVDGMELAKLPISRERKRRVLSVPEMNKLLAVAENAPAFAGMSGPDRAKLYRTMILSGLRLGELSRLTVDHVTATGFDIPATLTKNRKRARIQLSPELIDELIGGPGGKLFQIPKFNPDRLLKHDLGLAGIQRKTAEGVFDFHSFRHQCATILLSSGAPVKAVQSHMRHGTATLTLDTYGHLFDRDRERTMEVLEKVVQRRSERAGVNMSLQNPIPKWSHGESNPDLLNAIQTADTIITIQANELRDKRNRKIAPERAQRLLRKMYSRARGRR